MKAKTSIYESAYEFAKIAASMGLGLQTIENETFDGKTITLDGKVKKFFGNCSYLGLETDERLKAGAIEAIQNNGILLSCSRHYLSATNGQELLNLLETMFNQPCLLMPLTNLASAAVITTRINSDDAIILDQQVHMSVKLATSVAQLNGTYIETLPHNRIDILSNRIKELSATHKKIWYLADGVYSMFGDLAPMPELYALLDEHPNFRLFVDDAHGMSWTGKNGTGTLYEGTGYHHQQMYAVTSLGKGFGGQGAVAVFPNERERDIVRATAPQHIFLSPLGNAALGADIASAKLHLSDEFPMIQQELKSRIDLFNATAKSLNLPMANPNCTSPIFYIGTGTSELAVQFLHRLVQSGFYVNIAAHPAVPKQHAGMRIVLTRHQSEQDIKELLYLIHELVEELLPKYEMTTEQIARAFVPYFL
jgi:7-keto-8-aminopelargonate synthetase-like enzyme